MINPNTIIHLVEVLDNKAEEAFNKLETADVNSEEYTRLLNNGITSLNFGTSLKQSIVALVKAKESAEETDSIKVKES